MKKIIHLFASQHSLANLDAIHIEKIIHQESEKKKIKNQIYTSPHLIYSQTTKTNSKLNEIRFGI